MRKRAEGHPHDVLGADVRDFIAAMNARRVEFVLVGGYAVGAYGVIRATSDIDFLYRRTRKNVQRLCQALHDFGAPPDIIDAPALLAPDAVVMFGSPPQRIDLLGDISGVDFDTVWASTLVVELDTVTLRIIGLADLRKNKAASGRSKDKADLKLLPKAK
ncbi:MAG: hypothetical protein MUE41_15870 [Gemmatimonadaceae bacterium]|nr:hypothetical protein [Gemmatimonadaceae bacterium]